MIEQWQITTTTNIVATENFLVAKLKGGDYRTGSTTTNRNNDIASELADSSQKYTSNESKIEMGTAVTEEAEN